MKLADGSCDHEYIAIDVPEVGTVGFYYCDLCGRLEIERYSPRRWEVYETKTTKNETTT